MPAKAWGLCCGPWDSLRSIHTHLDHFFGRRCRLWLLTTLGAFWYANKGPTHLFTEAVIACSCKSKLDKHTLLLLLTSPASLVVEQLHCCFGFIWIAFSKMMTSIWHRSVMGYRQNQVCDKLYFCLSCRSCTQKVGLVIAVCAAVGFTVYQLWHWANRQQNI